MRAINFMLDHTSTNPRDGKYHSEDLMSTNNISIFEAAVRLCETSFRGIPESKQNAPLSRSKWAVGDVVEVYSGVEHLFSG